MIRKRRISGHDYRGNECILVARAVVSSVETLLGPGKSLKCCQSSGTSVTTSSVPKVLESMDIEHPAGYVINNACQNFYKQFGCGSATLVCLIGYWGRTVQILSEMGIPTPVISVIMDETYKEFENVVAKSYICLESLLRCNQDEVASLRDLSSFESMAFISERPAAGSFLKQLKTGGESAKRNTSLSDFPYMSKISDDYDEVSWYFDDEQNFKSTEKDSFSLPGVNVLKDKAFETKPISEKEQSFETLPKTEWFPDVVSGQVKRTCLKMSHSESTLNECSVEIQRKDVSLGSDYIKPSEHLEPLSNDEFDSCFDELLMKGDIPEVPKVPSRKITHVLDSGVGKKSQFQELLNSKVFASNPPTSRTGQKTNIEKVFLRSRYLANASATNLELQTGSIDRGISTLESRSLRHGLGDRCGDYLKMYTSMFGRQHKDMEKLSECNPAKIISGKSNWDVRQFELLGHGLAHGKEREMKYALEILSKQYTASGHTIKEFTFSTDFIALQTVIGPPSCKSCVLDGVVVILSKRNESILAQDCRGPRRIMLINGDIAFNYRHAGFKDPVKVTRVFEKKDFSNMFLSERNKWIKKVVLIVQNLNVGVIGVRGNVDNDLRDCWQGSGVVVLEKLNQSQLEMMSKMTKTSIVSYPSDFVTSDVGYPVITTVWCSGWSSGKRFVNSSRVLDVETITLAQVYVYVEDETTAKAKQKAQTLLLCGPVPDLVYDSELKFWNCVNRLRNAFGDQRLLPGGGEIELRCIEHLEAIKDSGISNKTFLSNSLGQWTFEDCAAFRPLIYDALIKGLRDFISRVDVNAAGDVSNEVPETSKEFSDANPRNIVFDNYVCKIEGWKRALRIVKLLLCSEYHIVTGV